MQRYEEQKKIADKRNSFSKTDHDATFMRMKDDHMRNGQLKAGYNVQMGTNNQFILHYTIHPNPTDTRTLKEHVESLEKTCIGKPKNLIADAGYGSEENYLYLQEKEITALVPYNNMRKEQKRSFSKKLSYWQNWKYNNEEDFFICPNGKRVNFIINKRLKDYYGNIKTQKIYECEDCSNCPVREQCTSSKYNRRVRINPTYEKLKAEVKQNLLHDKDKKVLYEKRKIEPESVFGNLKENLGCTRFVLRGKEKVEIEFGLYAMAHNLKKLMKSLLENGDEKILSNFGFILNFNHQKIRGAEYCFHNLLLVYFILGQPLLLE